MTFNADTRRVCLFAAFDPRMASGQVVRILPSTIFYLRALRDCGFDVHLALSGAKQLDDQDKTLLVSLDISIHARENAGHDFGAWQSMLQAGCADGADTILLANDSVFGPLFPLGPILDDMRRRDCDVWGMVESREARWHLQSWFLCFTAEGLASPSVRRIFAQPFHEMTRDQIVLHGELGLGAAIMADGLRWNARWHAPSRRLRHLVPGNSMHLDFLSVVRTGAVPFLKADLLRDNPARIGWADRWRTVLDAGAPFRPELIEQALLARPGLPHRRQTAIMRALYAAISCDRREATMNLFR